MLSQPKLNAKLGKDTDAITSDFNPMGTMSQFNRNGVEWQV